MPTTTPNMGLSQPGLSESADIAVISTNMATVDGHTHESAKGVPVKRVQSGTLANRPSAGNAGHVYVATDTNQCFYDNGTAWKELVTGPIAASGAQANLLANGGMEVWQRGTSFTGMADQAFGPDRWQFGKGGTSAMNCTRDSGNADTGSQYCAAWAYTHNATSTVFQKVENFAEYRGRTLSVCQRVKCGAAGAVKAFVSTDGGTTRTYSAANSGSAAYESLEVTLAVPSGATGLMVGLEFSATCTAYHDNIMLVVGSVAVDHVPLQPADELGRCQRYYQSGWEGGHNYINGAWNSNRYVTFPVAMAVTPTITQTANQSLQGVATTADLLSPTPTQATMRLYGSSSGWGGGYTSYKLEANP